MDAVSTDSFSLNTNLPSRLTQLIGREESLQLLADWLTPTQEVVVDSAFTNSVPIITQSELPSRTIPLRVLTLTGPGGSGKTSLAIELARRLLPFYPDGVWMLELASLQEPHLVEKMLASTLGLIENRPDMLNYLRFRQMLIVLDNCEHLIDECARLVEWLRSSCPYLRILVTSREPLNIVGEQLWRVEALSIPPSQTIVAGQLPTLTKNYDAVALLMERAQAVKPDFELTAENAEQIISICQRLEGMPLALELAAAQLKLLSVEQLANRLRDSFSLLKGGWRNALPHHQTLEATIEWSYSLLQPREQIVFRRLAIFLGGFSLEAAEIIVSDNTISSSQILELLGRLVDKSLLLVDFVASSPISNTSSDPPPNVARYRFLETVRQYAEQKLQESGEQGLYHSKLATFYLKSVEQDERLFFSAFQPDLIRFKLLPELANIRTALSWYRNRQDTPNLLRLASSLWFFWLNANLVSEGREWLQVGLQSFDEQPVALEFEVIAKALTADGQLAWVQGHQAQARSEVQKSLDLYSKTSDQIGWAFAAGILGLITLSEHNTASELDTAHSLIKQSIAILRNQNEQWRLANSLLWLGNIHEVRQQYEEARKAYQEAVDVLQQIQERLVLPLALSFLAHALFKLRATTEAVETIKESLILRRESGGQWYASLSVELLAQVMSELERYDIATVLYGAAESLRGKISASVLPLRQDSYTTNLAEIQRRLVGEVFEAALQRGQKMNLEQLVDYVLELEPASFAPVSSGVKAGTVAPAQPGLATKPKTQSFDLQLIEALSGRELQVLELLAQGASSSEMAESLVITTGTLKWHLSNIFAKLKVKNRTQAVARARTLNLLPDYNN